MSNSYINIRNNNHAKSTAKSNECDETPESNDDQLVSSEDACENSADNNDCDSGGSSSVADDELPSSSLNSSTEENRDELENHLNGTTRAPITKIIEPAVGSDWYLYCDANFTNVNLIEEKIYEDLCYVTFSTKTEVRSQFKILTQFSIRIMNIDIMYFVCVFSSRSLLLFVL